MCGIVCYLSFASSSKTSTPKTSAIDVTFRGLETLEYRGYDSAGIAFIEPEKHLVLKTVGGVSKLKAQFERQPQKEKEFCNRTSMTLGHTRWATHGAVTEANAHPHQSNSFILISNGIFENFRTIKEQLQRKNWNSETDTEVLVTLLSEKLSDPAAPFAQAMKDILPMIEGSLAAVWADSTERVLYGLRMGPPLVIGKGGDSQWIVASDLLALTGHVQEYVFVPEDSYFLIEEDELAIYSKNGNPISIEFKPLQIKPQDVSKSPYDHFMLKEVHEQPQSILQTLGGRVDFHSSSLNHFLPQFSPSFVNSIQNVFLIGCGSAYHASLLGKNFLQEMAGLFVDCEISSEARYREFSGSLKAARGQMLCIAVSQSGETADTIAAVKKFKDQGVHCLIITNVPQSTLARMADSLFLTSSGPEVGVAATKTFTSQVLALHLIASYFAKLRDRMTREMEIQFVDRLSHLPKLMEEALQTLEEQTSQISLWTEFKTFLFIGRGPYYPLALEGALKLKELTYLHAEGYAAGELKHGPIAMVDERTLCFVFEGTGIWAQKTLSNMEEVKARGSSIVFVGQKGVAYPHGPHWRLTIPKAEDFYIPYLAMLPVQVLAYEMAVALNNDPDRPRNLAKSVTVE